MSCTVHVDRSDAPQAAELIEGLPAEVVMADTAYDADHLRQAIAAKGALAVIPNNPSRALKYPLDKHLYAQRHLVECCFSKLKQFRRVATLASKRPPEITLPSSLSLPSSYGCAKYPHYLTVVLMLQGNQPNPTRRCSPEETEWRNANSS